METVRVTCPKCGDQFNVEDVIAGQLEETYRHKLNERISQIEETYKAKESELEGKERLLNQRQETIDKQVAEKTRLEVAQREKGIRERVAQEFRQQFDALEAECQDDKKTIRELQQTQIDYQRLQRRFETQRSEIELEFERRMNEKLQGEMLDVQRREAEKNELRFRDQQKIIDDQKQQIAIMQRRIEQGSVQLQGEVQELAIEEWLAKCFPLDTVTEVKKGARGADCLQTVHTHDRQNHGTIYYESKRTKDFQRGWIEKLRDDMREINADIGVLVTDTMPADMERMNLRDGIWICSYEEFKGLCFVLRESIIAIRAAVATEENKGEKMALLYSYLTSNEFRLRIEGIIEGFTQMQEDLNSEKRAMMSIWKKREKQIAKVLTNTIAMHGSIRGIAGNEIPTIRTLELAPGDEFTEIDALETDVS